MNDTMNKTHELDLILIDIVFSHAYTKVHFGDDTNLLMNLSVMQNFLIFDLNPFRTQKMQAFLVK